VDERQEAASASDAEGCRVKRHLLALTKRELLDLLEAVQGEADWLLAYGSPARTRRYKRLETRLQRKLEFIDVAKRAGVS
jgi:hypothetical protein